MTVQPGPQAPSESFADKIAKYTQAFKGIRPPPSQSILGQVPPNILASGANTATAAPPAAAPPAGPQGFAQPQTLAALQTHLLNGDPSPMIMPHAARGGTIERRGFDDGGGVTWAPGADTPTFPSSSDDGRMSLIGAPYTPMADSGDPSLGPRNASDRPPPSLGGTLAALSGNPDASWMSKLTNNPNTALLAASLGILSHAGERDAHGLPISGLAQVGRGGAEGLNFINAQQQRILNEQRVRLEAQRLAQEAQIAGGYTVVPGLGRVSTVDAQRLLQAGDIAKGVIGGQPTLARQTQEEEMRQKNQPQWKAVGRDPYTGQEIMGWVQPNVAPAEVQYNRNGLAPAAGAGAPPAGAQPPPPNPGKAANAGETDYSQVSYVNSQDGYTQLPAGRLYTTPQRVAQGLPPIAKGTEAKAEAANAPLPDSGGAAPAAKVAAASPGSVVPPAAVPGQQAHVAPGIYVPETTATSDAELASLTGEPFMQALSAKYPAQAQIVKSMLNGTAPPIPPTVRTPQAQRLMLWAQQADPSFNAMTWPLRNATAKSFVGNGINARQMQSAGTLVGHLDRLSQLIDQLHNSDLPGSGITRMATMPLYKAFDKGPGGYAQTLNQYNDTREKVAQEMTKLMAGGRGGTLDEVNAAKEIYDPGKSTSELKGAVQNAIRLIDSRLGEVNNQWNQAFGRSSQEVASPRGWLTPEHQSILNKLEGRGQNVVYPNPLGNPHGNPQQPEQGAIKHISSDADYDKLGPGEKFFDPQGQLRQKPAAEGAKQQGRLP